MLINQLINSFYKNINHIAKIMIDKIINTYNIIITKLHGYKTLRDFNI